MKIPKLNIPNSLNFSPLHSPINPTSFSNMEWRDGSMVSTKWVTAKEFLNDLYSQGKHLHLGDSSKVTCVEGVVKIDPLKFNHDKTTLENFEFENNVEFIGEKEHFLNLGKSIVINDCRFEDKLCFTNCKSEPIESDLRLVTGSIQISGGYVNELIIENNELPNGLLFSGIESSPTVIGILEIAYCNFISGNVSFKNTQLDIMFDFNFNKFRSGGLSFNNCNIHCGIRAVFNENPYIQSYGKESLFKKQIFIYHGKYKRIQFEDSIFEGKISLISVEIDEELKLRDNIFEETFSFESIDITDETGESRPTKATEEIWIQNNKFLNGFKFNSDFIEVKSILLIFSEKSSGVIEFDNSTLNEVEITGNNFNNSLFIRNCSYESLIFINFFNKALVSLNNNIGEKASKNHKEIIIRNSNLGNTEFFDFDFSIYPAIRIINSRLDNIFGYGVEWFMSDRLMVDEDTTDQKKILSQKREIYRQLKLAAEKQSDRITALFFKAREIEMHHSALLVKNQKKAVSLRGVMNEKINKFSDNTSILLGYTNQHGQNWVYPLFWVLAISTAIFYPLMVISGSEAIRFYPDFTWIGIRRLGIEMKNHFHVWPQLFNPTRRISDLFGATPSFWIYFWDGLQRIVLAFFIFQIVSAFRKFVK